MTIKLLHSNPLWLASYAIRMSRDNHHLSDTVIGGDNTITGPKDKELIDRIGNKLKHKSTLEQLVYTFDIDGISRACLQELARHRTARLTVKSTRYTLKQLKEIEYFNVSVYNKEDELKLQRELNRASEYLVLTDNIVVNIASIKALNAVMVLVKQNISNDILKYSLPESFKTRLVWQIDGRNLQNFLELRSSKDALWEIRELAYNIYDNLPEDHKYLYAEYIK
ncbi:MAG: FAD-dependent thymidylate synthase [Candidatus Cloacimonadaceae bacterium]